MAEKVKAQAVVTSITAALALVLSAITAYMQFFRTTSDLRATVSDTRIEYVEKSGPWSLTYDAAFMNLGNIEQIVFEAKVATLVHDKERWLLASSSQQLFEPLVVKPGEIRHVRLVTYACPASDQGETKGEFLSLRNPVMFFKVIDARGVGSESGFRMGAISAVRYPSFISPPASSASAVRPGLMDLRTGGDVPTEALSSWRSGNCIPQDDAGSVPPLGR